MNQRIIEIWKREKTDFCSNLFTVFDPKMMGSCDIHRSVLRKYWSTWDRDQNQFLKPPLLFDPADCDRQTDRQTDWSTDKQEQADWLIDRQTDRQIDWQTNWSTNGQTDGRGRGVLVVLPFKFAKYEGKNIVAIKKILINYWTQSFMCFRQF